MKGDITVIKGDPFRPAVVFIHGLGMDKGIWESPDESRVLGGRFPLSMFARRRPRHETRIKDMQERISGRLYLGEPVTNLTTPFHALREQGFTVIAWSQQRPSGRIDLAVCELEDVLAQYGDDSKAGIVIVGHSRGGLVARKYLSGGDKRIRCMITLATPHKGSGMARWVEHLTPLASLISRLLPETERGTAVYAVKKTMDFLRSKAVGELLPDSRFFKSLGDTRRRGVYYLSVGGSNPTLFSVYRRLFGRVHAGEGEQTVVRSRGIFSVPDVLEKIIPARLFPDEMKHGKGDGLVTTESSMLPWSDEHHVFDLNHAAILFDNKVKRVIVDAVNRL